MDEQRKYTILFAPTILAAWKLHEIGNKPCPARECVIADAICNAELDSPDDRRTLAGKPRLTAFCDECRAVIQKGKSHTD